MTTRSPPKYNTFPPLDAIFCKVATANRTPRGALKKAFSDHELARAAFGWRDRLGKMLVLDNSHRATDNYFAFRQLDLRGKDFAGSTLTNSGFSECLLAGANFQGARLYDLTFAHCDMANCNWEDAVIKNVTFWHCYNVPDWFCALSPVSSSPKYEGDGYLDRGKDYVHFAP